MGNREPMLEEAPALITRLWRAASGFGEVRDLTRSWAICMGRGRALPLWMAKDACLNLSSVSKAAALGNMSVEDGLVLKSVIGDDSRLQFGEADPFRNWLELTMGVPGVGRLGRLSETRLNLVSDLILVRAVGELDTELGSSTLVWGSFFILRSTTTPKSLLLFTLLVFGALVTEIFRFRGFKVLEPMARGFFVVRSTGSIWMEVPGKLGIRAPLGAMLNRGPGRTLMVWIRTWHCPHSEG